MFKPRSNSARFNLQMTFALAAAALISLAGCLVTATQVSGLAWEAVGILFLAVTLIPILLYCNERGWFYVTAASSTILWAGLAFLLIGLFVTAAARLGRANPLQDAAFIQLDQFLHVNVPAIQAWAGQDFAGRLITASYGLLIPFMKLAIVLPILTGRVRCAQRFLLANLAAFAIGIPLYLAFPAVGPWYGYHLVTTHPEQLGCEHLVLLIRQAGSYTYQSPDGVICFPSFHVIWAVLCAQAFWPSKWLRIPAVLLAGAIVLSTMTTGNHYFCDVLAGLGVAGIAVLVSSTTPEKRKTMLRSKSIRWASSCPRCYAAAGSPCRNAEGLILAGPHIQRTGQKRREIQAALRYYAGMGLKAKSGGVSSARSFNAASSAIRPNLPDSAFSPNPTFRFPETAQ